MSRHPATCEHVWTVGQAAARSGSAIVNDYCKRCPATCERDSAGKIVAYDADPSATDRAETAAASRRERGPRGRQ